MTTRQLGRRTRTLREYLTWLKQMFFPAGPPNTPTEREELLYGILIDCERILRAAQRAAAQGDWETTERLTRAVHEAGRDLIHDVFKPALRRLAEED
jgi:hypothetical protein